MMLEKLDAHTKKNKSRLVSIMQNNNFKWIKDLNVKLDGLKLLKVNISNTLLNIGIGKCTEDSDTWWYTFLGRTLIKIGM